MKKLLWIVAIGLLFTLSAKADDISDFQIEGMSIGDSLLKFMTKKKVEKNDLQYYPGDSKFYTV